MVSNKTNSKAGRCSSMDKTLESVMSDPLYEI